MTKKSPLTSAKYKKAEPKTYPTIAALARETGIDKSLFLLAKERGIPGFSTNGNVRWGELKPHFEKIYDELVTAQPNDPKALKSELMKRQITKADLEIRKMQQNLLEPGEVMTLLTKLGAKLSAVIKNEFSELIPKLIGKSEADVKSITDKSLKNIFSVFGDLQLEDVFDLEPPGSKESPTKV